MAAWAAKPSTFHSLRSKPHYPVWTTEGAGAVLRSAVLAELMLNGWMDGFIAETKEPRTLMSEAVWLIRLRCEKM